MRTEAERDVVIMRSIHVEAVWIVKHRLITVR
ncbi:unannotated protein [freshwater metagenome]|uniref:Unannotated protein n=1 Tax=freshwater metagenome TaxID=449393 RepID=A0A6J6LAR0_9ZZZZ